MKDKFLVFFITFLLCLCLGLPVLSAGLGSAGGVFKQIGSQAGADAYQTPQDLIGVAINAALTLVGLFFLVLMIYAGYLWLTARGEEEPINKAKKIITSSIIGFVLVASAYSITVFVGKRFEQKATVGDLEEEPNKGDPNKQVCCWVCKEKLAGDWFDEPVKSGIMSEAACMYGCTGEDADECAFDYKEMTDTEQCKEEVKAVDCEEYESDSEFLDFSGDEEE